ncbi:hypothetical protein OE88DRAFT_1669215 [Heliocybe sulcata]|uniref:Uncharacterized protein n=1 Tax=Heliocybe sulcata TaxID=5364 RepID=A0A5C3MMD0_9AGAM|nr:hypothetical protein OE88DRAFT_1669215 [Heliocybe sulcata]
MPGMSRTIEPESQLDDLRDRSLRAVRGKTDAGYLFPELLHTIFSFAFNSLGDGFATLPRARAESSWLSLDDKMSCSMVCKPWRDVAVPMLYNHVVLRRSSQLSSFHRTLMSQSDSFAYRKMVKSFLVDLSEHVTVPDAHHQIMDILSLCSNLAEMAYNPSQRTRLSDEAVSLIERLDPSLVTCLSLGEKIDSTPDLLQFLQELPRLQVLSLHSGRQLFQTLRKHPVSLPHVTTLSLTLDSNVTSGFALSTPSLTSLSMSFGPSWNDNPDEVIGEIIATVGQSLRYLDISWDWEEDGDSEMPGIFDLNVLEPCHALSHLVVRGVSSFVGTHPTIRFLDVWRDLIFMDEWRQAEQLEPEELIENQLQVEILRAHLPNIASVRVFDSFLRHLIPDLPTILLPIGRNDKSVRVHVLGRIIWDTPTMVFDEFELDPRRAGLPPLPHIVDEFVSEAYRYLGINIPDVPDADVHDWEFDDTGSPVSSEYESDENFLGYRTE